MAKLPTRIRALAFLVLGFILLFVGLQFIRPTLTNPPVTADLSAPAEVKVILKTSCYNCHSNETRVPWFDKVVPAYWLVVRDVKHGRRHMNFSDFGEMAPDKQKAFLYESVNQIQLGAMPPSNYLLVHPDATVTPAQLDTLRNYLHPTEVKAPGPEEERDHEKAREIAGLEAESQYQKWLATGDALATNVALAPNGLAFFPDYKNWKPISTTDRFDNDTFRVILGNDVAQRAIAENKIHPWPDGATFAKIAWKQHEIQDPATTNYAAPVGIPPMISDDKKYAVTVQSGSFVQVEFMTKDATKYASTEGWGFGRWRGTDLKPYGKTANFTMECANCHLPMKENDFVYTMPIHDAPAPTDLLNRAAALPADLPWQPLQWRVITSFSNKTDGTMSTLYGNDAAVDHARTAPQTPYPSGAILALVTWNQQEDRHWFGGRIPEKVRKAELVTVKIPFETLPMYDYESYEGSPLHKTDRPSADIIMSRVDAITGLKAAVMP
jgi:Haem-binding domain/Cytochrome P460